MSAFTLKVRYGLGIVEEADGGIGCRNRLKKFEKRSKATDSKEREFSGSITETGAKCERDFSKETLVVE